MDRNSSDIFLVVFSSTNHATIRIYTLAHSHTRTHMANIPKSINKSRVKTGMKTTITTTSTATQNEQTE